MTQSKKPSVPLGAMFAGLMSALFLVLAFAPFSFWGFAFLIPFPLFVIARSTKFSPSRLAFWAALGTFPGWIWTHLWISDVSTLGLIPLVIQLGFFPFLFVWISAHARQRLGYELIVFPVIWVAIEFFRGSILWGGYPWYLIAHPLIDSPKAILATPASWAGVYFVSFLCALYTMLLLNAITAKVSRDRLRFGLAAGILFTGWITIGVLLITPEPDDTQTIRVGVIQPDIPQDNRLEWTVRQRVRDWGTLRDLTLAAATDPTNPESLDVIIWPEGFVPGWTLDPVSLETERQAKIAWTMTLFDPNDVPDLGSIPSKISSTRVVDETLVLQNALDIPMVVGSVAYDNLRILDTDAGIDYQYDAMYNSAFVILNGEPQPVWYDKLHLTPFGEVMPYISRWEWLEQNLLAIGARGMRFSLTQGKERKRLTIPVRREGEIDSVSLATPICFEATISRVCRKLVFERWNRRASVLVNITNDGWFGSWDAGRETHLLNARWRCIELNTPMVRSANTGISSVIDHHGKVLNRAITPLVDTDPRQGYLIADVSLGVGSTVYAIVGDLFGWICFVIVGIWCAMTIFHHRRAVEPTEE